MKNHAFGRIAGALFALLLAASSAFAQTSDTRRKVSSDLQQVVTGGSIAGLSWAKDTSAGRMAKVLVIAKPGVDPDLSPLRGAVVAAGGTVYYRFISVNGVLAMLPVSRVMDIATRTDVDSISPNRLTARTKSLLEKATGVRTCAARAALSTWTARAWASPSSTRESCPRTRRSRARSARA
jgi:hypothetical protein